MLIHVIADYGPGDLAFAEVAQRLKLLLPDAELVTTPVPAFSTLAAGFCIAQLGLNPAPPGTLIYHNVAPRQDDVAARNGNAGERLAFARLPGGVRVVGACAGWTFSFIRDLAEELRWATAPADGSQFRSRDVFPPAVAAIVQGRPGALGETIPPAAIPDVPSGCICYRDGYGNLKTTFPWEPGGLRLGERVRLRVAGVEREAVVSDGSFAVEVGQLAFAPGSSGWPMRNGERVRWMELFLRGGSAWEAFGRPGVGEQITLQKMPAPAVPLSTGRGEPLPTG